MNKQQIIDNILTHEVKFHFTKSGGHGGQNVNKRETKVELYFHIDGSDYLPAENKEKLYILIPNRISQEGVLLLTSHEERYQYANKNKVIHRFKKLLNQSFETTKDRIATKVPRREKTKRKIHKIHHSHKKAMRKKVKNFD